MLDINHGGLDTYLAKLGMKLRHCDDDPEKCYAAVVNTPFSDKLVTTQLGLGIIVLLLNNEKTKTVDRIALSDTFHAEGAVNMSAKPFKEIKIPNDHEANIIVKAILTHRSQHTSDWKDLFIPAMSAVDARFNQAGAGIECSYVYPFEYEAGGALIFSYFSDPAKIGDSHKRFMKTYAKLVGSTLSNLS
jgi:hypothetical protein